MRSIARLVPGDLAGTGQAIYGTGIGAATVALTFLSGVLYERFWVMSAVCGLALPMAIGLRKTITDGAIASPQPHAS
jgi:PPP family 3-phenylpropionic acid transporter